MKVEQLMRKDISACRESDTLNRAAQILWERDCGIVPVVADDGSNRVVGMLTDRDICIAAWTQGRTLAEIPVASAMSHEVRSCRPSSTLEEAEECMRKAQVRRLPIVDEATQLLGVLSLSDVARRAAASGSTQELSAVGETLAAIVEPRVT